MPRAEDLPEPLRGLSRRQAVSLRDETWDADVDRLVAALPGAERERPKVAGGLKWIALAAAALAVFFLVRTFGGGDRSAPTATGGPPDPAPPPASARPEPSASTATGTASAIAIPRLAEVVTRSLIYTLLSGSVAPHGETTTLALRVRFSNDQSYPANFWDNAFRLAVGPDLIAPVSNLNEVVAGHSLRQGVVRFEIPAGTKQAVLKVQFQTGAADVPLDLTPTGEPSETAKPDTRDALSHAIVADLVSEPRPLATGKQVTYTLTRAYARRFVNAVRLVFTVRVANRQSFGLAFSSTPFRLLAEGQAEAPVEGPLLAVASNSDASGDLVFDVLPSTRAVVLRVRDQDRNADVPFDLPASVR